MLTRRSPSDLPQKRMRFEFRDRLSLSPAFAKWLEKTVEPDRENRFASAAEALQALEKANSLATSKTASTSAIEKPVNTRVVLNRCDRTLSIKIDAVELEIQVQSFKIVGSRGQNLLVGSTNKIAFVDLERDNRQDEIGEDNQFHCAIWEQNEKSKLGKKYLFGRGLQETEVRWIVSEISSFLDNLRLNSDIHL